MDLIFLVTQVLPDIKQLDRKSKSLFKLNVQTLIHNLKFGDFWYRNLLYKETNPSDIKIE